MATNPEWETQAYKEGALYFDEDPDTIHDRSKYKHTMYTNTALWWFRKHQKPIRIFTKRLISTNYLFDLIRMDTVDTIIYYQSISNKVDIEQIKLHYAQGDVKLIPISFDPEAMVSFKTTKGKLIPFETIFLAGDDTLIFDQKALGAKKEACGNRRAYRIKDKAEFDLVKRRLDIALDC